MQLARKIDFEEKVLVDHTSEHGPTTTHIRGGLLVGNLHMLRETGHYERYLRCLPQQFHETIGYALAASWVPMEAALAHCQACDELFLDDERLAEVGVHNARRVLDSFVGTLLRTARSAGADAGHWLALKQSSRLWERLYQGGGCVVLQTGPKDAVFEIFGNPQSSSRFFRTAHTGFIRGVAQVLTKTAMVKLVRPRTNRPHALAVSSSWV